MSNAKPVVSGTAATVVTGVREASAAGKAEEAALEAAFTMSGRSRAHAHVPGPDGDEQESELPVPAGVVFGGKYTVERMVAEGGMGVVCLGRHVGLDQVVAIKFLRRALAGRPSIVQRFLNEARALAALRSEHVVRVMDVGQLESGRPFLVMEHLDGIHLEALLDRDGALPVETAVNYVLQVCEPLAEAHALGIVHRDVKPENLFLWSGGPTAASVKVLDFGLAKLLGSSRALSVTGPQDSLGSPGYMSPEQVSTPQLVDSRTDIWSLGVVLYQLLTNEAPFGGGSLVEVLSHILQATPVALPSVKPGLDLELDAIVQRCLQKSPEARYQTMGQLADALGGYLQERERLRLGAGPDQEAPTFTAAPPPPRPSAPGVASDTRRPRFRPRSLIAGLIVIIGAAFYAADSSGRVQLRKLTDGWLTPRALTVTVAAPPAHPVSVPLTPFSRGITAVERAREANGAPALAAVPEPESAPSVAAPAPAPTPVPAPMTQEERVRRRAAYHEYLDAEGLTRLGEGDP